MKQLFYLSLFFLTIFTGNLSAQSLDKDKDPYAWAEENIEMIQQMTWEDWLKLGKEYRKPAFIQFSTEQVLPFWLAKIEDAKSLDWNDDEIGHLNKLTDILRDNAHWFDSKPLGKDSETGKEMNEILTKWSKYAIEELQWTNRLIGAIVMDGGRLLDKEGTLDIVSSGCQGGVCE